jgi:hypothetical protein
LFNSKPKFFCKYVVNLLALKSFPLSRVASWENSARKDRRILEKTGEEGAGS